jgi:hypothetical protein
MTEANRIHDRNKNAAAEAQYDKDTEAGILSDYETCSSCLAVVLDSELTATEHLGRICKECYAVEFGGPL